MRTLVRHAPWVGVRTHVLSALLLVFCWCPSRTLASDRTLCFTLPPPELLVTKSAPDANNDPARVYLGMNAEQCVPRAERDLRAAAARARLPDDDPALRCVDAQEAFLCSREFAALDDPFSCENLDGTETYRLDVEAMETCVWPVCEALCVQATAPANRGAHRRGTPRKSPSKSQSNAQHHARRHHATCARCSRACDVGPPRGDTPGGGYCAALAAQRLGGAVTTDTKQTSNTVDSRARYDNAWGCPGCDGGVSTAVFSQYATQNSFGSNAQLSAAAAALASVPVTASSVGSATVGSAAVGSVASTAAVGGTVALVTNFLFIGARVALLNVLFWAVVDSLYVVVRPGDQFPGYVYAQGAPKAPVITPPPPTLAVFGNAIPPPPSISPTPNLSPPPPLYVSPASPLPPSAICGVGDIARSCVGECGMCIFEPDADTPNCCCDAECTSLGDCCGDFPTCCDNGGAKLGVRVDARSSRRRVARRDSRPYPNTGRDFGAVDNTDLEDLQQAMDASDFGDGLSGFGSETGFSSRAQARPSRVAVGARATETVPIIVGRREAQGSTTR
jgi:hypothetical protein